MRENLHFATPAAVRRYLHADESEDRLIKSLIRSGAHVELTETGIKVTFVVLAGELEGRVVAEGLGPAGQWYDGNSAFDLKPDALDGLGLIPDSHCPNCDGPLVAVKIAV